MYFYRYKFFSCLRKVSSPKCMPFCKMLDNTFLPHLANIIKNLQKTQAVFTGQLFFFLYYNFQSIAQIHLWPMLTLYKQIYLPDLSSSCRQRFSVVWFSSWNHIQLHMPESYHLSPYSFINITKTLWLYGDHLAQHSIFLKNAIKFD